MPFEDDEVELKPKDRSDSRLKINNNQSSVQTKGSQSPPDFDDQAKAAFVKTEEYKQRAFELGKQFKKIIEDKTLIVNKGKIGKDIESEALSSLIQLGIEMNVDTTQQEGMGSMGVCTLLLKGLVMQRDRINTLEHTLLKVEKAIEQLSSRVEQGDKQK